MNNITAIDISQTSSLEINKKIENFKNIYIQCFGILTMALERAGLSLEEIEEWMNDSEFFSLKEKALECRHDLVESKLLDLIQSGEPSAIIFYCSTVLRHRGYKK